MGASLVRQAPAALGGVTATVVPQRSCQWREEKKPGLESQDKPLCLPSERSSSRVACVAPLSFLWCIMGDLSVNMLAQLSAQRRSSPT